MKGKRNFINENKSMFVEKTEVKKVDKMAKSMVRPKTKHE